MVVMEICTAFAQKKKTNITKQKSNKQTKKNLPANLINAISECIPKGVEIRLSMHYCYPQVYCLLIIY